jgi:tetratricopeptide (TPR) repeat protein
MDAKLARWLIIAAVLNLAASRAQIFMRPELQFRSDAEDLFRIAQALEKEGANDQAIHMFKEIVKVAENTDLAPTAAYEAAKIFMRKKFEMYQAREALEATVRFRGSEAAERAAKDLKFLNEHWGADGSPLRLWFQASEAVRAGQPDRALELLAPLCGDSPVVSLKPHALFQTGRILADKGMQAEAIAAYEAVVAAYPDHEISDRIRPLLKRMR